MAKSLEELVKKVIKGWNSRRGEKIPCPYCQNTNGFNIKANTECGFCTNGIHTIGE